MIDVDYFSVVLDEIESNFFWVIILVGIFLSVLRLALFISNRIYLRRRLMTWLEITPPASVNQSPEATQQLMSVIHGLRLTRSLGQRLLSRPTVLGLEIASSRQQGIQYLIKVQANQSDSLKKIINAYLPDSKIKEVLIANQPIDRLLEFKQSRTFILPLSPNLIFDQHDSLGYVTSAMTNLTDTEHISLQMIIEPIILPQSKKLAAKILANENILTQLNTNKSGWLRPIGNAASGLISGLTDSVQEIFVGSTSGYQNYYGQRVIPAVSTKPRLDRPARTLSSFEQQLMETMHHKISQPLFAVSLRLLITSPNPVKHQIALKSALEGFSTHPYQSLRAKINIPLVSWLRCQQAYRNLPSFSRRQSMILSASEVASLFHFPPTNISRTDNLITSLSRTLPAPVSLKQSPSLDIVIGQNYHHGLTTLIGLTESERQRHLFIIGGTGNGKTTLLQYAIAQDLKSGKGLAVVDPHGDLAETILKLIPEERLEEVVYFNPDDLDYPIGLNILELDPNLKGSDLLREKDLITESVISIFRKIFSNSDEGGHRVEYVLRNAIQTALTIEGATLFTIFKLIEDPIYRRKIIKTLDNPDLRNFWNQEINQAGAMQRVKMVAGITAKIGRFLFSASARQILEQPKSTIDFAEIIDQGKILICNLSKGRLGEDASELFGITVLAKLQLASLKRARLPQVNRRAYYIYVDEFQNFATTSFVQMLSESRKYKVFLIMAEQSTSQQADIQTVNQILANVGTIICFRTGNPQDEKLLLPLFAPYIEPGDIAYLDSYNFYARLSAIKAQEPMSGQTLLLESEGDNQMANRVIELSRQKYGRPISVNYSKNNSDVNPNSSSSIPTSKITLPEQNLLIL